MERREFVLSLSAAGLAAPPRRFEPDWESLKTHEVPAWYHDAKLGIFVHWGLYSVPAWAPPTGELGKVDWNRWFYENPYAEWYLNSLRLPESETYRHHAATYGASFDYYRFADTFLREIAKWKASNWAKLFRETGARYAVLTTKHHDGFTLWPSRIKNPHRERVNCPRDLVGDFTRAMRAEGLKAGLYYSGGLDWTFDSRPITKLSDLAATAPQTQEYADYADAHWRELIDRYQPAILWNDISYPKLGRLKEIFADYYNRFPDGLVNNRFGAPHADFTTPEYSKYDQVVEKKWESCRGLGFSFGYNQREDARHVLSSRQLIELLIDIVAKNGNLLLNVGPRADGSIPEIQVSRLRELGSWMRIHGEGIYGTRPHTTPAVRTKTGTEVRFTRKDRTLFAFLLSDPGQPQIEIPGVRAPAARLLGSRAALGVKPSADGLELTLPAGAWTGLPLALALPLEA